MNYRSVHDLNTAILRNLDKLPKDVDLVVGIPRSGLLAGNLLATHLNLSFADLDGFREGRLLRRERGCSGVERDVSDFRTVVVIDDSILTGSAMRKAKAALATVVEGRTLLFGAVYGTSERGEPVDFVFEECPAPRAFEWNMMHHAGLLRSACVELEGVLCPKPGPEELRSVEAYREFVRTASPLLPCSSRIKFIVSSRPESLRGETEAWLAASGIEWRHLVLCGGKDPVGVKSRIYGSDRENLLFIESDPAVAQAIADRTGKPVFCAASRRLLGPSGTLGELRGLKHKGIRFVGGLLPDPLRERLKRGRSRKRSSAIVSTGAPHKPWH